MPLPDNEVSRGKCATKALQYMATGRAAVVSPVGANVEVVRDGETGFLANSTAEFVSSLLQLAQQPDLKADGIGWPPVCRAQFLGGHCITEICGLGPLGRSFPSSGMMGRGKF